ncbi:MAG: sel1 repeat family protein, partial [Acidobacteria bacterium]|nr:sel1 repeat family protein [Acidobacteriota bacterium]
GDMYLRGDDLPQNAREVLKWYRKAAENGTEAMQIKLSNFLLTETSNYTEVHDLCQKAANRGYAPGAACMGELFMNGWGVDRNVSTAEKWFRKAANEGSALAILRLGQMYWKGEGLKRDRTSAYEFIYLASTSDLLEAEQEKERLEKELTPKELKKGKAKALEWSSQHPALVLHRLYRKSPTTKVN